MNSTADNHPSEEGEPTATQQAVHQAVRARALAQIEQERSRPPQAMSRRLLVVAFTVFAVIVFVSLVNFGVTAMYKIMEIWYPGSISSRTVKPPAPIDPSKPFFITVEPPASDSASSQSQSAP